MCLCECFLKFLGLTKSEFRGLLLNTRTTHQSAINFLQVVISQRKAFVFDSVILWQINELVNKLVSSLHVENSCVYHGVETTHVVEELKAYREYSFSVQACADDDASALSEQTTAMTHESGQVTCDSFCSFIDSTACSIFSDSLICLGKNVILL